MYSLITCDDYRLQHLTACLIQKGRQGLETRLGLQCQTPLRSYPLTLDPYPLSLIPYPLCQKFINSGYKPDHIRRIVVAGIKGWDGKVSRCQKEGRRIRRTASNSHELRLRTKLLGKSSWFKKKTGQKMTENSTRVGQQRKGGRGKVGKVTKTTTTTPSSVLFVDQTQGGETSQPYEGATEKS